jgi:hypothetical protein
MAISNGYCTLADVKASLRISDTVDDALIEMAVESASRLIDTYCARTFYNMGTATRYFSAQDAYYCPINDIQSVTTLKTAVNSNGSFDVTWAVEDFQLEPLNGFADGVTMPYTGLRALWKYLFPTIGENALVQVTGVWGWASVPISVKQATVIQASRIFKRNDSPLGVAGFGDMGVLRVGRSLDPDVQQLIDPYRLVRNFA